MQESKKPKIVSSTQEGLSLIGATIVDVIKTTDFKMYASCHAPIISHKKRGRTSEIVFLWKIDIMTPHVNFGDKTKRHKAKSHRSAEHGLCSRRILRP